MTHPTDDPLREEAMCSCGAGHGSLEGHMDWCDYAATLAAAPQPVPAPADERAAMIEVIEEVMRPRHGIRDYRKREYVRDSIADALLAQGYRRGGAEAGLRDDDSLSRQISELGNQIHNLGCEYQNDEKMTERLQELRSAAWDLARRAALARPSAPETLAWAEIGRDKKPKAETVVRKAPWTVKSGQKFVRVAIRILEGEA